MSATNNSSLRSVSQKNGKSKMNGNRNTNSIRKSEEANIRKINIQKLQNHHNRQNHQNKKLHRGDVDPNKAKARETDWLVGKVTFGSVLIFCLALFIVANLGVSIG